MLRKRHRAICSGAVAGRGIGKAVSCARDGIGGISGALWAAVTEAGSNGKEHASAAGLASGTRRKTWPSETTVFLKHADRDPNGFLSPDGLDNQKMLVATCSCIYWMRATAPSIESMIA